MMENAELQSQSATTKRVLITGYSGFLGGHIAPVLAQKEYRVIGLDKRPMQNMWMPEHFIQADVFDLTYRDLMGIDYVIHLAWRTNIPDCVRHPEDSTYQNIDMTVHLLEVAKEAGVKKVIFPSTASLYGNNETPWKEDMHVTPGEPYSWQKLSCEYLCKMYSQVYGLPTNILRFFQIFGENQREDTALAAFLKAKHSGKPITLTKTTAQSAFKSGQRDFIYAGDVAQAVVDVMERGEDGEIYNVASGQIHTMEEIAETIGGKVEWIEKRNYEVEKHHGDISKIMSLGWKPKVNVLEWLKHQ